MPSSGAPWGGGAGVARQAHHRCFDDEGEPTPCCSWQQSSWSKFYMTVAVSGLCLRLYTFADVCTNAPTLPGRGWGAALACASGNLPLVCLRNKTIVSCLHDADVLKSGNQVHTSCLAAIGRSAY